MKLIQVLRNTFFFSPPKIFAAWVVAFTLVFLTTPPLHAQDTERETAGAEQARFEKELQLEEETRSTDSKVAEKKSVIEEGRIQPEPALQNDVTFILKDIIFFGNEHISSAQLKKCGGNHIGVEVNLESLKKIADEIKQYYRDKGYIAAYVYLPPQDVMEGVVTIDVVEGKLGQVDIQGNKWVSTRTLRRNFGTKSGQIVFLNNLQTALRFLNANRSIQATAVLKPGAEPQTTDLELNVKDQFPLHVTTDVNNLGTDNTGKNRWGLMLHDTNVLGQMDEAFARVQLGKGLWSVGSDYNIPINRQHTRVGFSYIRSSVDVGGPFKDLGVEGSASTYSLYVTQPVYSTEWLETSFQGGFDWKSVENRSLGRVSGKDEFRIMDLAFAAKENDRYGRTLLPQSVHFGFDSFLGASNKVDSGSTRAQTGGQFFIYRGSLIRYQKLPLEMMYSMRTVWQLTPDRLAPSEQFRLGGAFSVRGYPEGDYLGDQGAFISQEVFVPSYIFPPKWQLPYSSEPLYKQVQVVGFFDFGGGSLNRPLAAEDKRKHSAGLGGGLRIHLFDRVFARFQWAGRVGSKSSDGNNSVFYYGISIEML